MNPLNNQTIEQKSSEKPKIKDYSTTFGYISLFLLAFFPYFAVATTWLGFTNGRKSENKAGMCLNGVIFAATIAYLVMNLFGIM